MLRKIDLDKVAYDTMMIAPIEGAQRINIEKLTIPKCTPLSGHQSGDHEAMANSLLDSVGQNTAEVLARPCSSCKQYVIVKLDPVEQNKFITTIVSLAKDPYKN